jgi:sulfatase maturation enzyme AslB (radical SAM superfamily)
MDRDPKAIVKTCPRIEAGMRLGPEAIRPCVFSVFESPVFWRAEDVPEAISKSDIVAKRRELFEKLNDDHSDVACKKCLKVEKKKYEDVTFDKLGFVDLAHYSFCNLRCDYCSFTQNNTFHKAKYDGLAVLTQFNEDDVEFDASVDFNGGEPSTLPNLGDYLNFLKARKIRTRLYTNAVIFSEVIERALTEGTISWLIISVDAGTQDTFNRTKRRDHYDTVVENLKRYAAACNLPISGQVASKYIFTQSNHSDADIEGFVASMVYAKPQHVWLLYDFHDFDKFHNVLYESVIKAYARMFVAFQKKGIIPSHFYESFLDPVVEESRELISKTKAAILELQGPDGEISSPFPLVSKENVISDLSNENMGGLLIAPANLAAKSLLMELGHSSSPVIVGDRCVHKTGKDIEGFEVVHYSELPSRSFDSLLLTSRYHSSAIIEELQKYVDLSGTAVALLDETIHRSL